MAMNAQRRRPFSSWVRKLNQKMKRTRGGRHESLNNNPYPLSSRITRHISSEDADEETTYDHESTLEDTSSMRPVRRDSGEMDSRPPTTAPSYRRTSLAGTNITTALDSRRGGDSTFSSPAPSARSVATTLSTLPTVAHSHTGTTHQGASASNTPSHGHGHTSSAGVSHHPAHSSRPARANNGSQGSAFLSILGNQGGNHGHEVQFSQPQALVSGNLPASTSGGAGPDRNTRGQYRPSTYSAIMANNLLNDNISILTLASSTQRRKRRSWDTDYDHASVRALPPASQFGGSRESLPLSLLSTNFEGAALTATTTGGGGVDRISVASVPGVLHQREHHPARSIAERSVSGYTGGHGRADSVNGSIKSGLVPVMSEG